MALGERCGDAELGMTSALECRLFPHGEFGREEGREDEEWGRGVSHVSSVMLVRGD